MAPRPPVLFHVFHTPAIARAARRIFGVSPATYRRLRDSAMTPAAIGVHGGRTPVQVRAGLDAALRGRGRRAVRGRAISAWQARALLAHQRADLTAYVFRRYRTPPQQLAFICRPRG